MRHLFCRFLCCLGVLFSLLLSPLVQSALASEPLKVTLKKADDEIRVEVAGKPFTSYVFRGYARPILYPVLGPDQTRMTRNYPLQTDTPGEANDHPHHKSIWFAHGDMNGVDFWSEKGKIVHQRIESLDHESHRPRIVARNHWLAPNEELVCRDSTILAFSATKQRRTIDLTFAVAAAKKDVVFGDTKEGMMAVRTHPNLRLDNDEKRGVTTANGHAVNSEGVKDGAMWGQHAAWVDYYGEIDGQQVGLAIMDHPKNLRHPTTWHARSYGLVAANPFGLSYFQKKPKGTGDFRLQAGEQIVFRYRIVLHEGDAAQANIEQLFTEYAEGEVDATP